VIETWGTIADALLSAFRGRADYAAIGFQDRTGKDAFKPQRLENPLQPDQLARHLDGRECLGFYLLDAGNCVWCACADFDNKPAHPDPKWQQKAETLYFWLTKAGLSPLMEISQSGSGCHVWIFFDQPTPAWIPRAFLQGAANKVGVPVREIFPKQDCLADNGLGNLVRYPLWRESHFADPENDWATLEPAEALAGIRRTSADELKTLAYELQIQMQPEAPANGQADHAEGTNTELPVRVRELLANERSLLSRRWRGDTRGMRDASRSALAAAISVALVREYLPTNQIAAAVRFWCREQGYEKGERVDWITRTVQAAYAYVVRKAKEKSREISEDPRAFRFDVIDSPAFDASENRPEFLIRKILVKGQPAVLGGPLKTLKTSISVDLAVSLGSATPFLGEFACYRQVPTVLLSAESGAFALQNCARRVCAAREIRLADCFVSWGFQIPRFSSVPDLTELREGLRESGFEVAVLDPLYMGLLAGPETDASAASNLYAVGPLLLSLAQACLSVNVTPLIVHHFRRSIPEPPAVPELAWLSHSGVAEFSRQWLLLSRRERYEPDKTNKHWLCVGGSIGHSGLYAVDIDEGSMAEDFTGRRWEVSVDSYGEACNASRDQRESEKVKRRAERDKEQQTRVLLAVDRLAGPDGLAIFSKVRAKTGLSNDAFNRALLELDDVLEEVETHAAVGVGKKGKRSCKGLRRRPKEPEP
jgi:replicative DNA helicase